MKKYLFLILLFIVYLVLIINKKSETNYVFAYDKNHSTNKYIISFNKGINSKLLDEKLKNYKEDIYIYKINDIYVDCNKFNDCIKQIYELNDLNYEINYITTGFKINKVELISDSKIEAFLNDNDINYNIK